MNVITAANLRRFIPAGAVAAVLAFSWFGTQPSLASNGGTGYNCGVKGIGYHDHGKVCPNRPFPGHGVGLAKFGIDVAARFEKNAHGNFKTTIHTSTTTTTNGSTTTSVSTDNESSSDQALTSGGKNHKSHGHGAGHVKGNR